jgi:hypothetical protein
MKKNLRTKNIGELKYKIMVWGVSIVSAMALTYLQIWGAAKISNKILWQVYLFFLLVVPVILSPEKQ